MLGDPLFIAFKAAVAATLAVLLVQGAPATHDALSAGFVALVCTSPSVHAGMRRGLEQAAGSLLGALLGGLPQALAPRAHGAPWALLPGLAAALLLCFRAGLGSSYMVVGFTVLYFHTLPFSSPAQALEARGVALAAGIGSAALVNAAVSSFAGPRITARRLALARAAVASALRGLAAWVEGKADLPPSFDTAFTAVAELQRDLTAAARERLFPGAGRTRYSALAGISHAIALEEVAHLGKEAALLAAGRRSPQPLAPLLALAASALESGPAPGSSASIAAAAAAASDALAHHGEPALASVARRLGPSVDRSLLRPAARGARQRPKSKRPCPMAAKPPEPKPGVPCEQILEGVGVGPIRIERSTAAEVVAAYGDPPVILKHGDYSHQMDYKHLGLSFYFRPNDPDRRIFFLLLSAPFQGITSRGVVLGQTTMQEAIKLYGPPHWGTTDVSDTWFSMYPGIDLHVMMEPSLARYPLDEQAHLPRPIVRIGLKR